MPNLSKDEIIKGLECCKPENDEGCLNCPFDKYSLPDCAERLSKECINLINRQQKEIKRLQERYDRTMTGLKSVLDEKADHTESINEFSEKLYNHILAYFVIGDKDIVMKLSELKNVIEIIKSEMAGEQK